MWQRIEFRYAYHIHALFFSFPNHAGTVCEIEWTPSPDWDLRLAWIICSRCVCILFGHTMNTELCSLLILCQALHWNVVWRGSEVREERRAMRRANQGQPHQLMIYTEQGSKNVHTLHKHHSRVSIITLSHLNTPDVSTHVHVHYITTSYLHIFCYSVQWYAKYGTLCIHAPCHQ